MKLIFYLSVIFLNNNFGFFYMHDYKFQIKEYFLDIFPTKEFFIMENSMCINKFEYEYYKNKLDIFIYFEKQFTKDYYNVFSEEIKKEIEIIIFKEFGLVFELTPYNLYTEEKLKVLYFKISKEIDILQFNKFLSEIKNKNVF